MCICTKNCTVGIKELNPKVCNVKIETEEMLIRSVLGDYAVGQLAVTFYG